MSQATKTETKTMKAAAQSAVRLQHLSVGNVNLAIRVSQELFDDFNDACKANGVTKTIVLKQLMQAYVGS